MLDPVKSLSYAANMLVTRLAQEQGADEALLVTPHGRVLEGPTAVVRLLARRGDARHAAALRPHPRLDHAPARARDRGSSTERSISADELPCATEAFLASTLREVHPVHAIDGVRLAAAPGPLTQRRRPTACARSSRRRSPRVKVVTVIGNRPQFVKAAAVSRLLRDEHEELLVHTGQHYDDELSTVFVDELGIPRPERELGHRRRHEHRADGAHARRARRRCSPSERPDAVLVYGDTNSTLAGGARRARRRRCPVAHVEAGMRSFDRAMPEELNRVAHRPPRRPAARARRRPRSRTSSASTSPGASSSSAT